MSFLLTTKLILPRVPASIIKRQRLFDMLNGSATGGVTLIVAPAGYGKTTLIGSWLNDQDSYAPAWLSLDEFDDDPLRFLRYFVAAWQTVEPSVGRVTQELLEGNTVGLLDGNPQSLLVPLINDLAILPKRHLLVLDDLHLLSNRTIYKLLNFWVDNAPSNCHLAITTRQEPQLNLSRWRVRNQLLEIREQDLQFTSSEAAEYLCQAMNLELGDEELAQLIDKTEGWAASLQLVALSLQGEAEPKKAVQRFSGSHRYVVDYLVDEVLERESVELQQFLKDTSILTHLTPEICNAITGRNDSLGMLQTLDQRNLFINATDQGRKDFRYHPLFADTLRKQLEGHAIERVKVLHDRAYNWFMTQENIVEAVKHGLAAEKFAEVAEMLNGYGDAAVWQHNQAAQLVEWCRKIPFEILTQHQRLMLDYGWGMLMGGARYAIRDYAEKIEPFFEDVDHKPYLIELETLKIEGSILQDDLNDALQKLNSIDYEGLRSASSYAVVRQVQGYTNRLDGNFVIAEEALLDAREACELDDNLVMWFGATGDLADTYRIAGRLHESEAKFQEMINRVPASRHIIYGGLQFALINYSWVYLRRNQLADALELAQQGLINARANGYGNVAGRFALWSMAYIRQAQGNGQQAQDLIGEAIQTLKKSKNQRLKDFFTAQAANLHLLQGNPQEAANWANKFERERPNHITRLQHHEMKVIYGRWLLSQNANEAIDHLKSCRAEAEDNGWGDSLLHCHILLALAHQQVLQIDSALDQVEQAVAFASPEGFIEPFVTAGRPMVELLRLLLQRGGNKEQIGRIQASFLPSNPVQPLIDPLTKREIEILRLMSAGLSNPEIADQLIIATGTVARHTNNIFGKLDVRNRTEATLKASSLNLI